MHRCLLIILGFVICSVRTFAQSDSMRVYTHKAPLLFEAPQDFWPFAYVSDSGEPEGYCIDLVRALMEQLDIPYDIRLKPRMQTLEDLEQHKADLTIGMPSVFAKDYGLYARSTIMLLTQSVAAPKGHDDVVSNFRDLCAPGRRVMVGDSSLCHHLMVDYGWEEHVVVTPNMRQSMRQINDKGQGQMVGNTQLLIWLMRHDGLDNVSVTPVNMPHGELRFMSVDRMLLDRIDKAYAALCADDKMGEIESRWLHPNYNSTSWTLRDGMMLAVALLLIVAGIYCLLRCLRRGHSDYTLHSTLSRQLRQLMRDGKVRFWTYQVGKREFTWYGIDGKPMATYNATDFAKRYSKGDFRQLAEAIGRLVSQHIDAKGHAEQEETLELKAQDADASDKGLRHFLMVLSVFQRDSSGHPTVILGTKKDVTSERQLRQLNNERSLRFWSMFYRDESGIILFDQNGLMQNANPKACELFQMGADEQIRQGADINHFFHTQFANLRDANGVRGIMRIGERQVEYQMKTVLNDNNELLGIYVFCL